MTIDRVVDRDAVGRGVGTSSEYAVRQVLPRDLGIERDLSIERRREHTSSADAPRLEAPGTLGPTQHRKPRPFGPWRRATAYISKILRQLSFTHTTIAARLVAIVLALAVPLNVVIVAVVWRLDAAANEAQRASLLYSAQSLAGALDATLAKYVALAEALSRSPALMEDDLHAFEVEARRAFSSSAEAWIVVADPDGQQLVNTIVMPGRSLPPRPAEPFAAERRSFETGSVVVSDMYWGRLLGHWIANVEVPVFRDGRPFRVVSVVLRLQGIADLLGLQKLPNNLLSGVIDGQGRYVARSLDGGHLIGQFASEGWRKIKDQDGIFEFRSKEGVDIVSANARSTLSGWTVGVADEMADLQAAALSTIGWAVALGGAISLLSIMFAIFMARRITGPLTAMRQNTLAVLADPSLAFQPDVPELNEVWRALRRAAAERKRAEEHMILLMGEISHRAKNLLSLVDAIARQTATTDRAEFLERFTERVHALGAGLDLLIKNDWRGVNVADLVSAQLAHFNDLIDSRITSDGPPLHVNPAAAQAIGMALHELATNAGKYGALSNETGTIDIAWRVDDDQFTITWTEHGGPPVTTPARCGFGTKVMVIAAEASLGGQVDLDYNPAGLVWRLRCPAGTALDAA